MQGLTLRLRGDGLATLRTEFPDMQTPAGVPVTPIDELGTWIERNGFAYVHFTQRANAVMVAGATPSPAQPESIMLAFALKRCSLRLVGDPSHVYGPKGLLFTKRHCP